MSRRDCEREVLVEGTEPRWGEETVPRQAVVEVVQAEQQ